MHPEGEHPIDVLTGGSYYSLRDLQVNAHSDKFVDVDILVHSVEDLDVRQTFESIDN